MFFILFASDAVVMLQTKVISTEARVVQLGRDLARLRPTDNNYDSMSDEAIAAEWMIEEEHRAALRELKQAKEALDAARAKTQ